MKQYVFTKQEMFKIFKNFDVMEVICIDDQHESDVFKNSLNIVKSILDNDREFSKD